MPIRFGFKLDYVYDNMIMFLIASGRILNNATASVLGDLSVLVFHDHPLSKAKIYRSSTCNSEK